MTADDEVKRRVRKLKGVERRVRGGGTERLVWDLFFDLREEGRAGGSAKYSLPQLAAMSREEYKRAVEDYFTALYAVLARESGELEEGLFDPELLAAMDMPLDADENAVKRRFRQLALRLHPDVGGETESFIRLRETYEKLLNC